MYHCATMPMATHIAAGMARAVVIEPEGLPTVDRSYLMVQSEIFLGAQGDPVNADKVMAEQPDAVVFNGHANQYVDHPLEARVASACGSGCSTSDPAGPRPSTSSVGSSTPSTRRAPTC